MSNYLKRLLININSIKYDLNNENEIVEVHYSIPNEFIKPDDIERLINYLSIWKIFICDSKIDKRDKLTWIVLHSAHEFDAQNQRTLNHAPFSQDLLLYDEKDKKCPIIHMTTNDNYWDFMCGNNINIKLDSDIPRYFQIMDNSIWNYIIPMPRTEHDNERERFLRERFFKYFKSAVKAIYENYKNHLYELPVAHEYADLNARIAQQSYLSGAHSVQVAPFIFHSETAIKNLIEKEFVKFKKGVTKDKWRILLVDDKAIKREEKGDPKKMGDLKKNCKLSIIMRLLRKELFPQKSNCIQYQLLELNNDGHIVEKGNVDNNAVIVIHCVQTLDDAIAALKEREYDLIMLDYLLDGDEERNYGYELLEKIYYAYACNRQFKDFIWNHDVDKDQAFYNNLKSKYPVSKDYSELKFFIEDKELTEEKNQENIKQQLQDEQFKIGPDGKLFFIFISAYPSTVNERLLAQGLNRSEDCWYINTGACPTNTPQLFTYNLLKLMEKRLNDCGILELSNKNILRLANKIFIPQDQTSDNSSVRKRASKYYPDVLNLQYHYRRLLDDVEIPQDYDNNPCRIFGIKESVLASHYIFSNQHLNGLLEHLTNLIHIAAFGTIRQWDEMWEEYLYFKAQFSVWNGLDSNDDLFNKVCGHIEEYILALKSQQR